jgi:hypothetical protein
MEEKEPIKTLLEWRSPSRSFQRYDKEVFSTMAAMAVLFTIVLLFIKEFLLIIVIWSLLFLYYSFSRRPPEEVEHKIATNGLTSIGKMYRWDELGSFWFENYGQDKILKILGGGGVFGMLVILLGNLDEKKVKEALEKYLPYKEMVEKTWSDKATDWLTSKFSFEKATKV